VGRWLATLAIAAAACAGAGASHATVMRFCDRPTRLDAAQQDKLLRFGAIIKRELDDSGQGVALIARSGLDLSRFGVRYSHAGFSLKSSENTPWAVRQLYYACDEQRPRIYDQGMSGFLLGTDDPSVGYVSVVLLPPEQGADIERTALDNRMALQLLSPSYSANAYPFSARYQNCNQWVVELMASAWGHLVEPQNARDRAQSWLTDKGYVPSVFELGSAPLMWLGAFVPWVHSDDHPRDDIDHRRYRVSMPASIEAFAQASAPGARRIEFCHTERHIVIRRGWEPIAEGCEPGAQDTVIPLD